MVTPREVVHREPAWGEHADSVIATDVTLADGSTASEQLWGRQVAEDLYELCCIPFFALDLAMGDVVEVDAHHRITRVVRPSGRYVFRVHLGTSAHALADTIDALEEAGGLLEWSGMSMIAVDARDATHASEVESFLAERRDAGHLTYEVGRT